ncbi:cytochrome P450 [Hypoxylon cercidicola]|nr:cytochrome P450 [Hypoxylon cercidicola]
MSRAIEKDFVLLGLNIIPDLIAPKGSRGRRIFFDAMRKYYATGGNRTASSLIQSRYEVSRKYDLSQTDIEHFNLSICYGLLVNTVPGTSRVLYYVYSNPSLLAELRQNIDSLVLKESGQAITINIPDVIAGCRLLDSLVQEVLRIHSTNASGRVVLKDTLIDDTYLLKKDSVLLIPSAHLHNSESTWGPDASSFNPKRLIKDIEGRNAPKVPACAYRAFGSGASACPGRYFATNEILAILVMMVLTYDVAPVHGRWIMPQTKSHITTSILTPVEDIERAEATTKRAEADDSSPRCRSRNFGFRVMHRQCLGAFGDSSKMPSVHSPAWARALAKRQLNATPAVVPHASLS